MGLETAWLGARAPGPTAREGPGQREFVRGLALGADPATTRERELKGDFCAGSLQGPRVASSQGPHPARQASAPTSAAVLSSGRRDESERDCGRIAITANTVALKSLTVEISPGELIDRLSILELKLARIETPNKRENIRRELEPVRRIYAESIGSSARMADLLDELRAVNARLWDIEDALRECERAREFGAGFVALARSVYRNNDRRHQLKQQINEALKSEMREEKSYRPYDESGEDLPT